MGVRIEEYVGFGDHEMIINWLKNLMSEFFGKLDK